MILASAWVAMVAWFLGVTALLSRPAGPAIPRGVRIMWAVGCGLLVLHVAIAFDLAHRWSHAAAFEHTREVGGFGEGIYVNYFFVALWLGDAIWLLASPESYQRRPRWLTLAIHGFMAFIVFNAMVVFGTWVGRGLFAAFVAAHALIRSFHACRRPASSVRT